VSLGTVTAVGVGVAVGDGSDALGVEVGAVAVSLGTVTAEPEAGAEVGAEVAMEAGGRSTCPWVDKLQPERQSAAPRRPPVASRRMVIAVLSLMGGLGALTGCRSVRRPHREAVSNSFRRSCLLPVP
jgi:hypothetical protein